MRTITTTYEEIAVRANRVGHCPGCGRKVHRQMTFTQTVNPWNTIGDGDRKRPKTRREVEEAVLAQAKAWEPEPEVFRHAKCAA